MNIFTFYNWRKRTNAQSNKEIKKLNSFDDAIIIKFIQLPLYR